jgi:acetylornithine deacetylase/succinyl-diaminopimelate desuccinylase-like protein
VRAAAADLVPRVLDLTMRIAAVPAPTMQEGVRSRFVTELCREIGLVTTVDGLGDVVAVVPGAHAGGESSPALLLAAHLDTVFVEGTPLPIRREGDRLYGPGIGDNSLGVAAVLMLPALLRAAGLWPSVDLILTGNVGEEGLGNLRGMHAVMDAHPRIGAVIAIEGHNLGRVTHVAVGSRRLRVEARGPGGHSWGDFGRPNAIHVLARLIAELADLPLPKTPKTTLNIGMIDGGVSVNSIAPIASCLLDLRSVDAASLRRLAERVDRVIAGADRDSVTVTSEVLGERPAGVISLDSPIVRLAAATLTALGIEPAYDASSTDANVAISRDVPAVCIGLTSGVNVHRADEAIDIGPIAIGLAQLALLTLGIGDWLTMEPAPAATIAKRGVA